MNWFTQKLVELQTLFLGSSKPQAQSAPSVTNLDTLKVVELRTIAKERGLRGYTSLRKAELIKMLQQN
tara:strand:- start:3499 stop:3702 length:204 start_codon:yes stop_codon:yes gene_type:complete